MDALRTHLDRLFTLELHSQLTMGRVDQELEPLTPQGIRNWFVAHALEVTAWREQMLAVYAVDGDLHKLIHPEPDWIREFIRMV